jgi:hypothetical protein
MANQCPDKVLNRSNGRQSETDSNPRIRFKSMPLSHTAGLRFSRLTSQRTSLPEYKSGQLGRTPARPASRS